MQFLIPGRFRIEKWSGVKIAYEAYYFFFFLTYNIYVCYSIDNTIDKKESYTSEA